MVRDDFVVNVGPRCFVNPRGKEEPFSSWGLAGGRSETSVRLAYQF